MTNRRPQAGIESPDRTARVVSAGGTVLSFAESEFLTRLGERVRAMRTQREMSRRDLARKSGISERYIAEIEAGRGNVSVVLLLRIARVIQFDETRGGI